MFSTFNMGVGMVLAVQKEDTDKAMEVLTSHGEAPFILGDIIRQDESLRFC